MDALLSRGFKTRDRKYNKVTVIFFKYGDWGPVKDMGFNKIGLTD